MGYGTAVRLAGAITKWRRATPPWLTALAHAALSSVPSWSNEHALLQEAMTQAVLQAWRCCACWPARPSYAPVRDRLRCEASRPQCALEAFTWLGALKSPAAAAALRSLPAELELVAGSLRPRSSAAGQLRRSRGADLPGVNSTPPIGSRHRR